MSREQRIASREAEDAERARLWEQHKRLEVGSEEWRNSAFMKFSADLLEQAKGTSMARGRQKAKSAQATKLLEALQFVAVASSDGKNGEYQKHVRLANKQVIATDGVLTAGYTIEEDFDATPNIQQLMAALDKCGKELAITVEHTGALVIKGAKLRATVDGLPPDAMPPLPPAETIYPINEEVRKAIQCVMRVTRESGSRVLETAVLIAEGMATATDGISIVQYWHGNGMPVLVLPRTFCVAVSKASGELSGFSFSDNSVTFYFNNSGWIRSQLYGASDYPMQALTILNKSATPDKVPADFFPGCEAVAKFAHNGMITLSLDKITTHDSAVQGAEYEVKGLLVSHDPKYSVDRLLQISDIAETFDINSDPSMFLFFGGNNIRGGVMSIGRVQ